MLKTYVCGPAVWAGLFIASVVQPSRAAVAPDAQAVVPAVFTASSDQPSTVAASALPIAHVVTPAMAGLRPVLGNAGETPGRTESVLGASGGTELLGGIFGIGLLLRYVNRRRLI